MTPDHNPDTDSNAAQPTPETPQPSEPQTVEAEVVEESRATPDTPKASAAAKEPAMAKVSSPKSAPKSAPATQGSSATNQAKAVAAEMWRQAKPILQKVGTQALLLGNRATDFLLDKAFPTAKEKLIQILPENFKTQAQEKIDPVKEKVVPIWQKVWPWVKKTLGPLWAKAIAFIRSKLPQDLSGQLSDRFLNILLVTTIYLVWSFFSGLTHPSQAKQPESDLKFPEVKNKPSMTAPERPKTRPEPSPPKATAPTVTPTPKATPTPKVTPAVPPKPKPPATVTPKPEPSQPEAAKKPEPIVPKAAPIAPKPAETKPVEPKAPITPAQPVKPAGPDLVALKADFVDSIDRVVEDAAAMIGKVSVKTDQAKLELSDRWYQLSEQDQTKLADNLFSKSKKLDYERLDIRDAKGKQIARSPYVGDNIIILKRSAPSAQSSDSPTSSTSLSGA